jgi:CysZ protein
MAAAPQRARPGLRGGLGFLVRGARYVYLEHRGLARFWVPPVLITLLALVGVGYAAFGWRDGLVEALWASPGGDGWLGSAARALHALFEWLVVGVLLVLGSAVVAMLAGVVAAPFNDALSEAVERFETGTPPPAFSFAALARDLGRSLRVELAKLGLYLALIVPLFVLSWSVPLLGPLLHSMVAAVLTVLYLAFDYADLPASRRGWSTRRRLGTATRHLRELLGFGAGVWCVMLVPLLNLLTMPAAVAGGTLLFLELHGPAPESGAGEQQLSQPVPPSRLGASGPS